MRSRRSAFGCLLEKELRDLLASRPWWIMLALIGPLVGVLFITAVRTYADVSAGDGTGALCGIVCSPLIGIWGPTLTAYELAAMFFLPFVAIRAVAGDRQSGALAIELQRPLSPATRIGAKGLVLFIGWLVSGVAAGVAIGLWRSYGGSVASSEVLVALAGHAVNGALTIGVAVAVASLAGHPATAAVITLGLTVGTWIIDLAAAVYGGFWTRVAAFTPAALLSMFRHGLVEANILLLALTLVAGALAIGALTMRPWVPARRLALESLAVVAVIAGLAGLCPFVPGSWDASESRMNSFPPAEAAALATIQSPLLVDVHLAVQDARRAQFERGPLAKVRRVVARVIVRYHARTVSGLFEQADPGYGEIGYELEGRRIASRVLTDEGVVDAVLTLSGRTVASDNGPPYPGRPLQAQPAQAALVFYGIWPATVAGLGWLSAWRRT